MISVIVPVYNVAKYLPACIESILAQSYSNFELLLVDDGSTDGSLDICNSYASQDNRIKVLSKHNGGVSSARNLGLTNCKGEWVAFVDGDDYVAPDYLSIMVAAMSHGNTDLVISGFTMVDDSPAHHEISSYIYQNEDISIDNITIDQLRHITHWSVGVSKLFSASVIKESRLQFPPIAVKEDVVFLISYLDCCRNIRTIEGAAYFYVQRRGSALRHTFTFEERLSTQLKYSCEIKALQMRNNMIRSYFKHDCQWVIISDTYYTCKNPLRRIEVLKQIDVCALNPQYLPNNRYKKFDSWTMGLLKRHHYAAYDMLKFTEILLIRCLSALIRIRFRWFSR